MGQWLHRSKKLVGTMLGAIAVVGSLGTGVIAAETLRFKVGPLQQTLRVDDLAEFAETGNLPKRLKLYQGLFTPQLRSFLQQSFKLDPAIANQALDELWRSPTGTIILDQLQTALPNSSADSLKDALSQLTNQKLELNALNLLRAYPADELTIDLTAIAQLLLQANFSNLQSQILSATVSDDLEETTVPPTLANSALDPTTAGNQAVRKQTIILRDYDRERTIPLDIYDSPEPKDQLVVLSHGFAANRRFLDYLAYHLASHGYVVVTADHPGSNVNSLFNTNLDFANLLPAEEFIERPKDISFILDELEKLKDSEAFPQEFATENVTVIGHSFGGYTALALAGGRVDPPAIRAHCDRTNPLSRAPGDWLQCAAAKLPYGRLNLRDKRIKQAIALNPVIGEVFGEEGLAKIEIPTLIFAATKDAVTPSLTHQLRPFQVLESEKYLVVADGATHMSITDLSNRDSLLSRSTLVPEVMGAEAEPVRQMLRAISLSFLERRGSQGADYGQFLSAGYVQSLSSDAIQLRFTQTLSAELQRAFERLTPESPDISSHTSTVKQASFLGFWQSPPPQPILPLTSRAIAPQLADLFAYATPQYFLEPYSVAQNPIFPEK